MRHRFPTPLRSLRGSRGYERNRDRPQLGTTATRNLVVKLHIERMVPGFHVVGKITVLQPKCCNQALSLRTRRTDSGVCGSKLPAERRCPLSDTPRLKGWNELGKQNIHVVADPIPKLMTNTPHTV